MLNKNPINDLKYWPARTFDSWAGVWPEAFGMNSCHVPLNRKNGGYHSFNYIQTGALAVELEKEQREILRAPAVFMIAPGQHYHYVVAPEARDETRLCWIRLGGPCAAGFLRMVGLNTEQPVIQPAHPCDLDQAFEELYRLYTHHDHASDAAVIRLLYGLITTCGSKEAPGDGTPRSLAARIRDFMFDELETGYNVSQIARFFGLSRSGLFLHFKKEFGESPVKVLQKARLERARHLLRETDLNMADIARASGYAGVNRFLHHFKAAMRITPTQYRKR